MKRYFNTTGACDPQLHYMVDIRKRLREIKKLVDAGQYFTINRARQYGKTTTLTALADFLSGDFIVASLDFQKLSSRDFESETSFANAFAEQFVSAIKCWGESGTVLDETLLDAIEEAADSERVSGLRKLFLYLSRLCASAAKPVVLIIDEVDSATNNQVFLDFLAQLRGYYLTRKKIPAFWSVIFAGVYDVRSVKRRIRPDEEYKENSPWNIAADFDVTMSFSTEDIAGMLKEYEKDYQTGMCVNELARLIFDYTSGYPFLVSRICKMLDEEIAGSEEFLDKSSAWTRKGFLEAEKRIIKEDNTLYQSLIRKLKLYPELKTMVYQLLFTGKPIPYTAANGCIKDAAMFGFIKNQNDMAVISNRIFESVLYNLFISEEYVTSKMYDAGLSVKNQFFTGGHLNVRRIMEKFVETFDSLYADANQAFLEDAGRRYFMLFLKPIINGVGNSYVEAETRNHERMDLVIDYHGEQSIIELKIWRGNAYHERGEEQLSNYLEYFHLKKGYMLNFCFNKKKEVGVKEIILGDKVLIEAVV